MARAAVFAFDCTDGRVIKRMRSFQGLGVELLGFTFRRQRYNRGYVPEWDNVDLGTVPDRGYGLRLLHMVRALFRIWRRRAWLAEADVLYATNLDNTFLALFARRFAARSSRVVMEVADIRAVMLGTGVKSRLFRRVERFALNHCDLLVTTSPGFVRNYFEPVQRYHGPTFLLENKLFPPHVPEPVATSPLEARPEVWVIGYFGALRGERSWDVIVDVAERAGDAVMFYLRGVPTAIDRERFFGDVRRLPNVVFEGEYRNPEDLAELYGRIHFVWCFELANESHNSRWLLPNRLYEGGFLGVPQLAPRGFQVGDVIEEMGIGWTFDAPYGESVSRFLESLDVASYNARLGAYGNLPEDRFASRENFRQLWARASGGAPLAARQREHNATPTYET